jgi:hypothetical protein
VWKKAALMSDPSTHELVAGAKSPLLSVLSQRYHEPSANAVNCIDVLAARLAKLEAERDVIRDCAHRADWAGVIRAIAAYDALAAAPPEGETL